MSSYINVVLNNNFCSSHDVLCRHGRYNSEWNGIATFADSQLYTTKYDNPVYTDMLPSLEELDVAIVDVTSVISGAVAELDFQVPAMASRMNRVCSSFLRAGIPIPIFLHRTRQEFHDGRSTPSCEDCAWTHVARTHQANLDNSLKYLTRYFRIITASFQVPEPHLDIMRKTGCTTTAMDAHFWEGEMLRLSTNAAIARQVAAYFAMRYRVELPRWFMVARVASDKGYFNHIHEWVQGTSLEDEIPDNLKKRQVDEEEGQLRER